MHRNNSMLAIVCLLTIYLLGIDSSFASVWTHGEGSGQSVLTFNGYKSSKAFDGNGKISNSSNVFRKYEINPFIEYGVTEDINVNYG